MFDGDGLITIRQINLESGMSLAFTSGRDFITQIFTGRLFQVKIDYCFWKKAYFESLHLFKIALNENYSKQHFD